MAATSGEGSTAVGIEWRGGTCELEGGSSVGDCSGQGSGRSSQDESGLHVVQAVTGSAVQHAVLAKFQQVSAGEGRAVACLGKACMRGGWRWRRRRREQRRR